MKKQVKTNFVRVKILTELETRYSIQEREFFLGLGGRTLYTIRVQGKLWGNTLLQSIAKLAEIQQGKYNFFERSRLLPFDFTVVHTPKRTLGKADSLSHPSYE